MPKPTSIAVLLFSVVCACSNQPAPQSASSPPVIDLVCPVEPAALTDQQVTADVDGSLERQFELDAIIAGRACRDALHRTCVWQKERGAQVDCDTPSKL